MRPVRPGGTAESLTLHTARPFNRPSGTKGCFYARVAALKCWASIERPLRGETAAKCRVHPDEQLQGRKVALYLPRDQNS